ncbi:MAG: 50S ribosomal protein L22 [Actinobacteria bacterium]|jgi:large subunit ribosomal protein L22|nr:50S ribosomal protein L22 [Actinomycetota bacterium]MBT3745745.1 50S ribosomal protein L22 [Actinomycetota bacterium]MBT3969064.1 50S ribosomal protein L22 [Actinomycetota bacterium]MBT4010541.1 50S ribosomal protein L22 [Actinomycetota bacterium]MBT4302193.1 50S ribosomal protein L22 [Actinomycetota bacterium]
MVATKTNERPGTRAVVRHVRVSASKARAVLDLIRGQSYGSAAEILAFSDRSVAEIIAKGLDSAVANAEHNDGIPAEELFVSSCYADVGPTLKRWRPRARGRATPIRKRTCHITIIVGRYTPEQIAEQQERNEARGRSGASNQAAEARRQRVERSRASAEAEAEAAAAAEAEAEAAEAEGTETEENEEVVSQEVVEEVAAEEEAAETPEEADDSAEAEAEEIEDTEASEEASDTEEEAK